MLVTFFVFTAARRRHAAVGTESWCQYLGGACVMSGGPFCTPPWLWLYWLYVWGVETGGAPEVGGGLTGPENVRRKKKMIGHAFREKKKPSVWLWSLGSKFENWAEIADIQKIMAWDCYQLGLVWPCPIVIPTRECLCLTLHTEQSGEITVQWQ